MAFSKARLEGRALEHALAGDGGSFVSMHDEGKGSWVRVSTKAAKAARSYMQGRAEVLVDQLSQRGFSVKS